MKKSLFKGKKTDVCFADTPMMWKENIQIMEVLTGIVN